jgi:hypothetical protein
LRMYPCAVSFQRLLWLQFPSLPSRHSFPDRKFPDLMKRFKEFVGYKDLPINVHRTGELGVFVSLQRHCIITSRLCHPSSCQSKLPRASSLVHQEEVLGPQRTAQLRYVITHHQSIQYRTHDP